MDKLQDVKYAEAYRPGIINAVMGVGRDVFRAFQLDSRSSENRIGDVLTSLSEEDLLEVPANTSRSKYTLAGEYEGRENEEVFGPYMEFAEEAWRHRIRETLEEFDTDSIIGEISETELWTRESNSGDMYLAVLKDKEYSDETKQYLREIDVIEKNSMKLLADDEDLKIVREMLT